MNRTSIEWVKNPDGTQGYTWNPITGCLNGCPYCYARKLANGRLKSLYLSNRNLAPFQFMDENTLVRLDSLEVRRDPFYPRFWAERIPAKYWISTQGVGLGINVKGKGIFVCDMGELFGDWIPYEWQVEIFRVIKGNPDCRFYLLTKQPQNLIKFSPFPDNCWVGVTVTNVGMMADAITNLAVVKAKVKYMSFEPLLGSVMPEGLINFLDWVIIGGQTNPEKPPKLEWVEEIVKVADGAGIKVFLKNNLWPLFNGSHYTVPLWAFDAESKFRQEMGNNGK